MSYRPFIFVSLNYHEPKIAISKQVKTPLSVFASFHVICYFTVWHMMVYITLLIPSEIHVCNLLMLILLVSNYDIAIMTQNVAPRINLISTQTLELHWRYMAHILFEPKARIDAIERTWILLRWARRIFAKIGTQGFFGSLNTNLETRMADIRWWTWNWK